MQTFYPDHQPSPCPACAATIGFFDGVPLGHRHLLQQLRAVAAGAALPAVVVTFDQHPAAVVRPNACPPLLSTLPERLQLLADCGIDACAVLRFDRAMAAMPARQFMQEVLREQVHVSRLCIGYDHHFGHGCAEGFHQYTAYGQQLGVAVEQMEPFRPEGITVSSSAIRQCLANGNVQQAARLLGRPYTLTGTVVHGVQEGRRLGFPTANIQPPAHKMLPLAGVYAVSARVAGEPQALPAMMNIGTRPTFHGTHTTLEVHILHCQRHLYGATLHVEFIQRLRNEQTFDTPEALRQQLLRDAEAASNALSSSHSSTNSKS